MPEDNLIPDELGSAAEGAAETAGDALQGAAEAADGAAEGAANAAGSATEGLSASTESALEQLANALAEHGDASAAEPVVDAPAVEASASVPVAEAPFAEPSADYALGGSTAETPTAQPFSDPNVQVQPFSDGADYSAAQPVEQPQVQSFAPADEPVETPVVSDAFLAPETKAVPAPDDPAAFAETVANAAVLTPEQQPQAQQAYDPAAYQPPVQQAGYNTTNPYGTAQEYRPNEQAAYQQAYQQTQQQYAQPAAPQYVQQGSNPGTVPLVLGILSIVFAFLASLIGLVLSIIGIVQGRKALKLDPHNGRAKAGKITSIVGLVLSIISFILGIVLVVTLFSFSAQAVNDPEGFLTQLEEIAAYDETGELQEQIDNLKEELGVSAGAGAIGSGTAGSNYSGTGGYEASSEDEAAAFSLADEAMKYFTNPSASEREEIEDYLDEALEYYTAVDLDDTVVTKSEFTDWFLNSISYTNMSSILFSDTEGFVSTEVQVVDLEQFLDICAQNGIAGANGEEAAKIMRDAMANTAKVDRGILFDVRKSNGVWTIDDESASIAYKSIIGL